MNKFLLSLFSILLCPPPGFAQTTLPKDIDSFIENVRKYFEVPGLAIAIVKDGKIIMAKGYGERKVGARENVDEHTVFGIASNTKIFTATALAILEEEGKLEWDKPVIHYLPSFQLSDPYVSREMTVRDLLVHHSGLSLGAGDLLWWPPTSYSRSEIVQQLKHLPLTTSFRSTYAYDNVLYLVAGELVGAVSGTSWETFVATRILKPIGMNETSIPYFTPSSQTNVATPHAIIDNRLMPVTPFTGENFNPAAGINSSVNDIAKWLTVQMDSGRLAGKERIFRAQTANELWSIVSPFPSRTLSKDFAPLQSNFSGYALGLNVSEFRGKKILSHSGALPGYYSKVSMIPELKAGVVILTNQECVSAMEAINYFALDYLLNVSGYDWFNAWKRLYMDRNKRIESNDQAQRAARNEKSKPSLPLVAYTGKYSDPWYGDVSITVVNNVLDIQFDHSPSLKGKLEHWQFDTFVVRWYDRELRADAYITFSLKQDGTIDFAKMKPISLSADFSFDFQDLNLKKK